MRCIMLKVEYDGKEYSGWQVQPGQDTVQGFLESAIEKLTGSFARIHGSGRTDSGVHAVGQVAHFHTESTMPGYAFSRGLNAFLPKDIAVRESAEVSPDFHARYSAQSKVYRYEIENSRTRPVLDRHKVWWVSWELEFELLQKAADAVIGRHDFTSFTDAERAGEDNFRTVRRADWSRSGTRFIFEIEGEGFLYKMVRCLVGTFVEVARGRIGPDAIREILAERSRSAAGPTAPPQGLCLLRVEYLPEEMDPEYRKEK